MKDSFQHHVDNLFRDSLQFHKKEPGSHVWENIESELDKDDKISLLNINKAGLKKTGTLLLLFFFLSSIFIYHGLNPVQTKRSVFSADVKKSAGNLLLKPIKASLVGPDTIESDNTVNLPFHAVEQN